MLVRPLRAAQEPNVEKLACRLQHICNLERVRIDKSVSGTFWGVSLSQ